MTRGGSQCCCFLQPGIYQELNHYFKRGDRDGGFLVASPSYLRLLNEAYNLNFSGDMGRSCPLRGARPGSLFRAGGREVEALEGASPAEQLLRTPASSREWPWLTIQVQIHLPCLCVDFPLPLLFILKKMKKMFLM